MGQFWRLQRQAKVFIDVDEVPGFLDRHIKKLDTQGKVSEFLQDVKNKKSLIAQKLQKLEEKHPKAEKYAEVIRKGLLSLDIPTQHAELAKKAQFLAEQVSETVETSQQHYYQLKDKMAQDIMPVEQKMRDLEKVCADLAAYFERLGLDDYRLAREKYEDYIKSKERVAKLKEQLLIEDHKRKEPLKQMEKIQKRKEKLLATRSYEIYAEIQKQREELIKQRREILSDYEATIEQLKATLEKFKEKDNREKVINDYIQDPAKALVADKTLVIVDIAKDLAKKVKGDLKEAAKTLTKTRLKKYQEEVGELQGKIEELTKRLYKDSIGMMLREQVGYEQTISEALEEIEKNKEMIENELERTSIRLAWQHLRDALQKLGKHIILREENKKTVEEVVED